MTPAEQVQSITSIIQAAVVLIGIYFAIKQIKLAVAQLEAGRRSQQAQTLLAFDQMLDRHEAIHKKLRPGGEWAGASIELSASDWADIERYMGLFERAKVLIDDGFLDVEDFDHLYGYRVRNIRANPTISREKLERRAYGWRMFLALEEQLNTAKSAGT